MKKLFHIIHTELPGESFRFLRISLALIGLLTFCSCSPLIHKIGGAYLASPDEMNANLSIGAQQLISRSYEGIEGELIDYHIHILGVGSGDNGTFVNPDMKTWMHPISRIKFLVYLSASGITDIGNADEQYFLRLKVLAGAMKAGSKFYLLAFDKYYNPDGTVNYEKTSFYVPNEYVFKLAADSPDLFVPVVSIHPYRKDALAELEKWSQKGVRYVKWLPSAMGMDPSDPAIDPFYQKMKDYGMVLITHTGEEHAVEAEEDQELGNPLLLRRPLDSGVRVVMAHFGGLGKCFDLENPEKDKVPCIGLCLRLMWEKKYDGLLFGEISSIVQDNRVPDSVMKLLEHPEIHHRLINGSDYPIPGVNILYRMKPLVKAGLITSEEGGYLKEIYEYNPLLFDLVLKRTVKHPDTNTRFPVSVFTNDLFSPDMMQLK